MQVAFWTLQAELARRGLPLQKPPVPWRPGFLRLESSFGRKGLRRMTSLGSRCHSEASLTPAAAPAEDEWQEVEGLCQVCVASAWEWGVGGGLAWVGGCVGDNSLGGGEGFLFPGSSTSCWVPHRLELQAQWLLLHSPRCCRPARQNKQDRQLPIKPPCGPSNSNTQSTTATRQHTWPLPSPTPPHPTSEFSDPPRTVVSPLPPAVLPRGAGRRGVPVLPPPGGMRRLCGCHPAGRPSLPPLPLPQPDPHPPALPPTPPLTSPGFDIKRVDGVRVLGVPPLLDQRGARTIPLLNM